MSSNLPDTFTPSLSMKERTALEAWVKAEGWTREKSILQKFGYWKEGLGESMPRNLVAPGVTGTWGGEGNYVCVMCGYVTSITNIHRSCSELPADQELIRPVRQCSHDDAPHYVVRRNERVWTGHRSIAMVKVS